MTADFIDSIEIAIGDLHLNAPAVGVPIQLSVPVDPVRRLTTKGPGTF